MTKKIDITTKLQITKPNSQPRIDLRTMDSRYEILNFAIDDDIVQITKEDKDLIKSVKEILKLDDCNTSFKSILKLANTIIKEVNKGSKIIIESKNKEIFELELKKK